MEYKSRWKSVSLENMDMREHVMHSHCTYNRKSLHRKKIKINLNDIWFISKWESERKRTITFDYSELFKGENVTNQIILHWTEVSALKKDLYTRYELRTIYTEFPAMREWYVQRSRVLAHCRILSMLYTYDIFCPCHS